MMESSVVEGAVEVESGRGNEESVVVVEIGTTGRMTKRREDGFGVEVEVEVELRSSGERKVRDCF